MVTPDVVTIDSSANQKAVAGIRALVQAIERLPVFSKRNVETLLGMKLTTWSSDPHYSDGALPRGPLARVVLHEPSPDQKQGRWILGFEVRDGVELKTRDFDPGFLGDIYDIEPRVPPEGTVSRRVLSDGTARHMVFMTRSERLLSIRFERDVPAAPSAK